MLRPTSAQSSLYASYPCDRIVPVDHPHFREERLCWSERDPREIDRTLEADYNSGRRL